MVAAGQFPERRFAVRAGNEEFVRPEVGVGAAADRHADNRQHGLIKTPAGREIAHDELEVIDQPAAMQFLCFHWSLHSLVCNGSYAGDRPSQWNRNSLLSD